MTHSRERFIAWLATSVLLAIAFSNELANCKISFEKMTNRDFVGTTVQSIQNVSLFECLGWCKEDAHCTSAAFSFVVNPFAALQETTCSLQNETQARQLPQLRSMSNGEQVAVVVQPQRATNMYFFNKIDIPSDNTCQRLWAFERFPNRKLRHHDRPHVRVSSKEMCLALCVNGADSNFVCRSAEYNHLTNNCFLNGYDRRSPLVVQTASQLGSQDLLDSPGNDYFENACLLGEDVCTESRIYDYAKVPASSQRVAHYVELNYYPDKEMLVKSQAGCLKACTIEHEFICRSVLFRTSFKQGQPNCALYHLDHKTFPGGPESFAASSAHAMQPLLDSGDSSAVYLEAVCNDSLPAVTSAPHVNAHVTLPASMASSQTLMTNPTPPTTLQIHTSSGGGGGNIERISLKNSSSLPFTSTTPALNFVSGERRTSVSAASASSLAATLAAATTLSPLGTIMGMPTSIRMPAHDNNMQSVFVQTQNGGGPGRQPPSQHITIGSTSDGGVSSTSGVPNRISISASSLLPATPPTHITLPVTGQDQISEESSNIFSNNNNPFGNQLPVNNYDQNCDSHGFCYNVSLRCTDLRMVVNVKTQRPFHGRIYALGRSETCNAHIKNQNAFQLELMLSGQDCNTQSASGVYTNTIVLQHHNVVLTKADKVYHVRCTYETQSRNVSFNMLPVKDMFEVDMLDRNQETIHISASPDAPLPKISIRTAEGKEASTVRIGDRLTFRIEIPESTPYGIFARSCIAMAKEGKSTFDIIDDAGCPVDHTIFPNFLPAAVGNALESNYEAFRFTESYGVIFQCNIKYCIGKCEPAQCNIGRDHFEAWGRKKRSIDSLEDGNLSANGTKTIQPGSHRHQHSNHNKQQPQLTNDDMTLSREIVVLDFNERVDDLQRAPATADKQTIDNSLKWALKAQADQVLEETNAKHCLSSASLMVLIGSVSLFFVLYVCLVAYFFSRRHPKISAIKHQYH